MPEIRYPALFIDTSSKRTWVGLKQSSAQLEHEASHEEASISLFRIIRALLEKNDLETSELKSLIICHGPGSMLGIRTAIMGARAWEGVGALADCDFYIYSCLLLGTKLIPVTEIEQKECILVTDARRNSWNAIEVDANGSVGTIHIMDNEALEAESRTIYTLEAFPIWTKTTAQLNSIPYRPESVFDSELGSSILEPVNVFTPLSLRESTYTKWSHPSKASS